MLKIYTGGAEIEVATANYIELLSGGMTFRDLSYNIDGINALRLPVMSDGPRVIKAPKNIIATFVGIRNYDVIMVGFMGLEVGDV